MPYRDQAIVESWVQEFRTRRRLDASVNVLEKDFTSGPESGLVVVALRTVSTVTYIQPVVNDRGPRWVVTFESRGDAFDLDYEGVAALAQDLTALAQLTEFLQHKTDEVLREKDSSR